MKKIVVAVVVALATTTNLFAQQFLTLEQCHEMAATNNKKQSREQQNLEMAKALRQAAFANFFPKVSANAAYYHNSENICAYPTEGMANLRQSLDPATNISEFFQSSEALQQLATTNPELYNQLAAIANDLTAPNSTLEQSFNNLADKAQQQLKDALTFDVKNVFALQVGVTQPIYVGGRLREAYNIAKANERIASIKAGYTDADLMVDVDEAYWRVLSVENKKKLADQYVELLEKFAHNVEIAQQNGQATKADLMKVQVKINEAKMSQARAENGLQLSKMALCQLLGLPLNSNIKLDETGLMDPQLSTNDTLNMDGMAEQRQEIQLLEEAYKISESGVKIAAANLQPNIVATAGYAATTPNMVGGFNKNLKGYWHVGVVMNVPIAHASDIYMLKAAKHASEMAHIELDEAREKIELQANQSNQKFNESNKSLIRAQANIKLADENLRMAETAYKEGFATATEVMAVQTAWLQAHSEVIDAAIETKMTYLQYLKHTGQLNK